MSKINKLATRFKSLPTDFSWQELVTLLTHVGFKELQGSGSRVKFYHAKLDCLIHVHKPHPAKLLKPYMVKEILNTLIKERLL